MKCLFYFNEVSESQIYLKYQEKNKKCFYKLHCMVYDCIITFYIEKLSAFYIILNDKVSWTVLDQAKLNHNWPR